MYKEIKGLNPHFVSKPTGVQALIRKLCKKIWRKTITYTTHDEVRVLNILDRMQSPILKIGDYSYGHPDTNSPHIIYFGENTSLTIGKFCSIAENVQIFIGGYHNPENVSTYPLGALFNDVIINKITLDKKPTVIGNDVWLGAGSTIMAGITVGDGAIIATNSVVTRNVEPYSIYGGNPAKKIKLRFEEEKINALLQIQWWNWDIEKIKANAHLINGNDITNFINKYI